MNLSDVKPGMRVALHPATSLWMRGVRYADVVKVGRTTVIIEADNHQLWRIHPSNIEPVETTAPAV